MTQLMLQAECATYRFSVETEGPNLDGTLAVPVEAEGVVIFAHGGSGSRLSPRNRAAARLLNQAGFATLLVDLLTIDEEAHHSPAGRLEERLGLLSRRLLAATDALVEHVETAGLPLGYFAIGVGTAAALLAATLRPAQVGAIASCNGVPDLASARLTAVGAPTLLIVSGEDQALITRSQAALHFLPDDSALALIPGVLPRCDRPNALELAAPLAARWYERFLR